MRSLLMLGLMLSVLWSLPATAQNVTCESRDGGYRECYSGFRNPPVLVRQLSDSSCVEGRSWGHRPGSIWVSKGCRASFQESRGGGSFAGNGIVCESRDNRYVECRANFRGPVELVEQLSSSQCIEGSSWGSTRGGVWVDRGCRARFAEYYGGGGSQHDNYWEQSGDYSLACESKGNGYTACSWDWSAGTPYLLNQLSSSPCVRGRSWGYDSRQRVLWVDQGCRAEFGAR